MKSGQGGEVHYHMHNQNIQIVALDPVSWEEYVTRNPGPIIKVIDEDSKTAGRFRESKKGYRG